MVSSKAVPEELDLKFRSKFYHGCLYCEILRALYGFKERAHKLRDFPFKMFTMRFLRYLKLVKNYMKFSRSA